ncbi:MAG: class I SAM-dependent methyltransferase [Actinomycetota bacterium]|nr:class I SAM-dependent methyltransferase [Actinomycetota bacterium]
MVDDGGMLAHYTEQDEAQRLFRSGHGRLELERTRELLDRHLPHPPATVLDVGGATGVHAAWLAARGYQVHLVDPVSAHVESAMTHGTFTAGIGDARSLPCADDSADAVLLLGPLYHLVAADDRVLALGEASRVLRPGGVLLASAIGRFMALLDWTSSGGLTPDVAARLRPVLATGVHDPSLGFTSAFFHTAVELFDEVRRAGFRDTRVVGIDGPAWTTADHEGPEAPQLFDSALRCARLSEDHPELVDASAHLMAMATK